MGVLTARWQVFIALLLASLSFFLPYSSQASKVEDERFHFIRLASLSPPRRCAAPSGSAHPNEKGGLRVVHRRGSCSPFRSVEKPTTNHHLLQLDQYRVDYIHAIVASSSSNTQIRDAASAASLPAQLGTSLGTLNYIVTLQIGTPPNKLSLAFDTGSDLTWIQCQPCTNSSCYTQKQPIFDPSRSSSYFSVSCSSPQCAQLSSATGNPSSCSSSTCQYTVNYGDGSTSSGSFAQETLTLTDSDAIPDFYFGCGHENKGLFGSLAGLLGLGRDPLSLVQQTASKYNRAFSYCLPTSSSSTGYLKLGSEAMASDAKFTRLVSKPDVPFYFLEVIGIRVGGQDLPISPSAFANPGTIIDSGTVVSRLPPAAYSALRTSFRQAMVNYTMAGAFEIFDTCYDLSGVETVTVPKIVLRFAGEVDLDVDITGILLPAGRDNFCLAFAGNKYEDSVGIIGNRQQRTYNIVYDVGGERVGFGSGGCS